MPAAAADDPRPALLAGSDLIALAAPSLATLTHTCNPIHLSTTAASLTRLCRHPRLPPPPRQQRQRMSATWQCWARQDTQAQRWSGCQHCTHTSRSPRSLVTARLARWAGNVAAAAAWPCLLSSGAAETSAAVLLGNSTHLQQLRLVDRRSRPTASRAARTMPTHTHTHNKACALAFVLLLHPAGLL